MRYRVHQRTRYEYDYAVATAQHLIRLTPGERPGQRVLSAVLEVEPGPAERHERTDFFGNRITGITLDVSHDALELVMDAEVVVERPAVIASAETPAWERVRELTAASRDAEAGSPIHGLFPSRSVEIVDEITEYAAASFGGGRPALAGAFELAERIKADFAYEPGATDVTTSPAEAFARRRGVCQDFAQVMIAGMRGLGLPALYVSGYLRTTPPPGKPRLEGADATHAWVAAWCGPEAGWVGLDPTNAVVAGEDHITIAVGRDYVDVAPIGGVIVSAGEHRLTVAVDVVPAEEPGEALPVARGTG